MLFSESRCVKDASARLFEADLMLNYFNGKEPRSNQSQVIQLCGICVLYVSVGV